MAEPGKEKRFWNCAFAISGIMITLVIYGVLQASKKALDPVAPVYNYVAVSISNILTTTCQYEALKYVSFPVQTLAKCAKMIPVMALETLGGTIKFLCKEFDIPHVFWSRFGTEVWGTLIMQKRYYGKDYLLAVLVTLGCSLFILYPASTDISPYNSGRESTVWGIFLMIGYLGTFMKMSGIQTPKEDQQVATASQFFISYTIRTFGALTFATIMTTRQLVSILLSCVWFGHPLSWEQYIGAVIVFGSLYTKSFLRTTPQKLTSASPIHGGEATLSNDRS
ncbi:UDP-galactose/UDP-glucose transporter 5 [Acorus calamus]|uniref:UDP-galactose/UDP-glucose transporter 5 n=1 Tax=Acorus calamus TaxID=4465 RepID=A0AAV9EGT1_ACOCL|nr:UDP-galactose/UDP-glucose transporter 5 [Acorus calamus]